MELQMREQGIVASSRRRHGGFEGKRHTQYPPAVNQTLDMGNYPPQGNPDLDGQSRDIGDQAIQEEQVAESQVSVKQ